MIGRIATSLSIPGLTAIGVVAQAEEAEDSTGFSFDLGERIHEPIGGVLGVSVKEYDTAIETALEHVLDEALIEGWLTEDQADWMLERAGERATDLLENTWEGCGPSGRPGGFHGGGQPGRFGSFPGQRDA